MSTIFFDIQSALNTKLSAISGHPKIVMENDKEYEPSIGTRYWQSRIINARADLLTASMNQKHTGTFHIDVYVPANTGLKQLMNDLDTIYTQFNTTTSLTSGSNKIEIASSPRGDTIIQGAWCRGYIQIHYICYA